MEHGSDVWSKEQSLEESQKKKKKQKVYIEVIVIARKGEEVKLIRGGRGEESMENVQLFLKKKGE